MATTDGTILIADDEMLNRTLLRVNLEGQGFTVHEVENGRAALDFLRNNPIDILLLDLLMPEMDGFEVLEILKKDEDLRHLPVLIISASDRMEDIVRCIEMGATDYLPKPFDPTLLRARVNASLNAKRVSDLQREYTQALQVQNQELDAFARTVAHDLKTPVSAIYGYADLFVTYFDDNMTDDMKDIMEKIIRNGQRMSNIIDALLLLARLRNDLPPIQKIEMAPIVHDVLDRLNHVKEQFNGEVILPAEFPSSVGYGPWVEEVWANYISNAFKHGGENPKVEIGARKHGASVRFWVKDSGPGISAEAQKDLFTEFNRLGAQGVEGHGLGLSIVVRIAEKLNGTVGVDSVEGEGSIFWFTLPQQLND